MAQTGQSRTFFTNSLGGITSYGLSVFAISQIVSPDAWSQDARDRSHRKKVSEARDRMTRDIMVRRDSGASREYMEMRNEPETASEYWGSISLLFVLAVTARWHHLKKGPHKTWGESSGFHTFGFFLAYMFFGISCIGVLIELVKWVA
jgi:hypothetical protein